MDKFTIISISIKIHKSKAISKLAHRLMNIALKISLSGMRAFSTRVRAHFPNVISKKFRFKKKRLIEYSKIAYI